MEFCLRTPAKSREKIVKSCGKHMIETGKIITMQDLIVKAMAERVGMNVELEDKQPSAVTIKFPDPVYKKVKREAAKKNMSINSLILETVEKTD